MLSSIDNKQLLVDLINIIPDEFFIQTTYKFDDFICFYSLLPNDRKNNYIQNTLKIMIDNSKKIADLIKVFKCLKIDNTPKEHFEIILNKIVELIKNADDLVNAAQIMNSDLTEDIPITLQDANTGECKI